MLKSEEVCTIVKACGEAGVSELKFGNLYLKFLGQPETPKEEPSIPVRLPDTEISEAIKQSGTDRLEKEEFQTREDELDHMLVENPSLYEQMVLRGELESKDSGTVDGNKAEED